MSPLVLTIVCMVVSFVICGIPFGLLIARLHGVDVRKEGSGNIGMTRSTRYTLVALRRAYRSTDDPHGT